LCNVQEALRNLPATSHIAGICLNLPCCCQKVNACNSAVLCTYIVKIVTRDKILVFFSLQLLVFFSLQRDVQSQSQKGLNSVTVGEISAKGHISVVYQEKCKYFPFVLRQAESR
jgi:hypothetical protein